jgi:hypothetical protein
VERNHHQLETGLDPHRPASFRKSKNPVVVIHADTRPREKVLPWVKNQPFDIVKAAPPDKLLTYSTGKQVEPEPVLTTVEHVNP